MTIDPAAAQLTVGTWNLERGGIDRDGSTRRYDTARSLLAAPPLADADVLCVQEANWTPAQADAFAAAWRAADYRHASHPGRGTRGTHLMVLVRASLRIVGTEAMPHWLWEMARCPALLVTLEVTGWPAPLTVATTHLSPWGAYGRLVQAEALTGLADRGRLLLAGDFNALAPADPHPDLRDMTPAQVTHHTDRRSRARRIDRQVMGLVHDAGFVDVVDATPHPAAARAIPTSGGWPPPAAPMLSRKDQILLSPGLAAHADVADYRVADDPVWWSLSDHRPVLAALTPATRTAD